MGWDYARADRTLYHARTKECLLQKLVAANTRLQRYKQDNIFLLYRGKKLIHWSAEGRVALTNSDWWTFMSRDRLNRFMPTGFRVWQKKPYWFLQTPSGVRPWRNEMELDLEGKTYGTFHPEVATRDAPELWNEVEAYAKEYVAKLLRGLFPAPYDRSLLCKDCTQGATVENASTSSDHILQHLRGENASGNFIYAAITSANKLLRGGTEGLYAPRDLGGELHIAKGMNIPRQVLRDAVSTCWSGTRALLMKPRTKAELVTQTELRMTAEADDWRSAMKNPRVLGWNLRRLLADYMLDSLGFQRMR